MHKFWLSHTSVVFSDGQGHSSWNRAIPSLKEIGSYASRRGPTVSFVFFFFFFFFFWGGGETKYPNYIFYPLNINCVKINLAWPSTIQHVAAPYYISSKSVDDNNNYKNNDDDDDDEEEDEDDDVDDDIHDDDDDEDDYDNDDDDDDPAETERYLSSISLATTEKQTDKQAS